MDLQTLVGKTIIPRVPKNLNLNRRVVCSKPSQKAPKKATKQQEAEEEALEFLASIESKEIRIRDEVHQYKFFKQRSIFLSKKANGFKIVNKFQRRTKAFSFRKSLLKGY